MSGKDKKQRTVAIIPARGGSTGILKKNLVMLGSKPLVAWPIQLAQSVSAISRIIVSTDDPAIAMVAKKYGAEVPFLRPDFLSGNEVTTLPVLKHTLEYLISEERYEVDNVILLYPTSPFLKRERIIESIKLLENNQCETVIGVRKVRGVLWKKEESSIKLTQFYPKKRVNRQLFSPVYEEAGNIYFTKAKVILEQNKIVNELNCHFLFMEDDEMIDIDTESDLLKAKKWVKERGL